MDVGPLIDEAQREKVAELVDDAVATRRAGAARRRAAATAPATSSSRPCSTGVPDDARVLGEEIFGPVAPIATFSTEEQALAAANRTEYGLVAYVYTRDLDRALRVCEGIETGMVGLNQGVVSNPAAPFGGVKQSGFGREGGLRGDMGVPGDEVRGDGGVRGRGGKGASNRTRRLDRVTMRRPDSSWWSAAGDLAGPSRASRGLTG